jgi:hypothetical protein
MAYALHFLWGILHHLAAASQHDGAPLTKVSLLLCAAPTAPKFVGKESRNESIK